MDQCFWKRRTLIAQLCCWSQVWTLVIASSPDSSSSPPGGGSSLPSVSMHTGSWGLPKVDHYSTIGFPSPWSVEEQTESTKKFANDPDTRSFPASTPGYTMLHLPSKSSGAELWGGVNAGGIFFGNDPHFAGLSRIRAKLTRKIEREHEEGYFQGIVNGDCGMPFDFYCPTYQLLGKHLPLPATVTVQVAAFACEIEIFDTLQDYEKHNEKEKAEGKIAFASQSFSAMTTVSPEKLAWAFFTGHVVRAELKINERTGESFYWAVVETLLGCQFDVVIHPMLVNHHPPRRGSIVQGAFYLSGCVL